MYVGIRKQKQIEINEHICLLCKCQGTRCGASWSCWNVCLVSNQSSLGAEQGHADRSRLGNTDRRSLGHNPLLGGNQLSYPCLQTQPRPETKLKNVQQNLEESRCSRNHPLIHFPREKNSKQGGGILRGLISRETLHADHRRWQSYCSPMWSDI